MNKQRLKWLRRMYKEKHGEYPAKTVLNDGSFTSSIWRKVKKHFIRTKQVL